VRCALDGRFYAEELVWVALCCPTRKPSCSLAATSISTLTHGLPFPASISGYTSTMQFGPNCSVPSNHPSLRFRIPVAAPPRSYLARLSFAIWTKNERHIKCTAHCRRNLQTTSSKYKKTHSRIYRCAEKALSRIGEGSKLSAWAGIVVNLQLCCICASGVSNFSSTLHRLLFHDDFLLSSIDDNMYDKCVSDRAGAEKLLKRSHHSSKNQGRFLSAKSHRD
jgi:hypothetical protein